jgi:hypothetical protein
VGAFPPRAQIVSHHPASTEVSESKKYIRKYMQDLIEEYKKKEKKESRRPLLKGPLHSVGYEAKVKETTRRTTTSGDTLFGDGRIRDPSRTHSEALCGLSHDN